MRARYVPTVLASVLSDPEALEPQTLYSTSRNGKAVKWVPLKEKTQPLRGSWVGWAADCPECGRIGGLFVFATERRPMAATCIACRKWTATP